jgi:hypothetical protein
MDVPTYLDLEVAVVDDDGVVGGPEFGELLLDELALVAGASVLEPDGHLLGVQAQLAGQLHLARCVQLAIFAESHLQPLSLLVAEAPLLLLRRRVVLPRLPPTPRGLPAGRLLLTAYAMINNTLWSDSEKNSAGLHVRMIPEPGAASSAGKCSGKPTKEWNNSISSSSGFILRVKLRIH